MPIKIFGRSMNHYKLLSAPEDYGSKGQAWNADFVKYMVEIATHPTYAGMPDAIKDDGKIQWEAPSNRQSGKYKDTHHKRREWWKKKAEAIGINPNSNQWISETAKKIHPTSQKPCKRCGRIMLINYVYPNGQFKRRLQSLFGENVAYDPLESISDVVQRLVDEYGDSAFKVFPKLLETGTITPPQIKNDIDSWKVWIEDEYIPREPSLLSPGAMSNAPDRFDGFHSFNLCCRKKADTGRHDSNMRTYTTDRRVFEYWSEGDWIAADRLMGLISAKFRNELAADGGTGPCSADHIGPLSLGFFHRPEFRLLSKAANSAKNNRMTLWDVNHLNAKPLWDLRKDNVSDEETALRLSKLLRDNQRNAMNILGTILEDGHLAFLTTLLKLEHAERNIEFDNLRIQDYITIYDKIVMVPRNTKYVVEQKARRLRIAFEALRGYTKKENRHSFIVTDTGVEANLKQAICVLQAANKRTHELNTELNLLLFPTDGKRTPESQFRQFVDGIKKDNDPVFIEAHYFLVEAMKSVAKQLSDMWGNDRYTRAAFDFEND